MRFVEEPTDKAVAGREDRLPQQFMNNLGWGHRIAGLGLLQLAWNINGRVPIPADDEIFGDDNSKRLDVLFCKRKVAMANELEEWRYVMGQIVLLRHGESQWNLENRFTGWVDVPLSSKGEEEARAAGVKLKGYRFDRAFTSVLIRANETLRLVLEQTGQTNIPIEKDQALNERMYGDLQGLNKAETAAQYGEQQVKIWRRSYDVRPPNGESLKDTAERVLPYYERRIKPHVLAGETILIAAHGNSLRALVMHLDQLSKEQVLELNIPTGAPLVYDMGEGGKVLDHRYL